MDPSKRVNTLQILRYLLDGGYKTDNSFTRIAHDEKLHNNLIIGIFQIP